MPLTSNTGTGTSGHDPSATLRGDPRNLGKGRPVHTHRKSMEVVQRGINKGVNSQTSDSSASSTAPTAGIGIRRGEGAIGKNGARIGGGRGMAGPLSPKRKAELSGKGSEGSPSMGSSFSDLDGTFSFVVLGRG